jgi:hypothetical protein
MAGLIVKPIGKPAANPAWGGIVPAEMQQAFSQETRRIAAQVEALRTNAASPTTLRVNPIEAQKELPERLFDARSAAKVLTASVAMHLDPTWRERLFQQLDSLHDPEEWEEGDEPLQQSSYATFLKAMLTIDPEIRPGLGLSHGGHLIAAWTTGRDRLTIEFLPGDRVRWVLARFKHDEPSRFAGQTPVTELAEGLAPHRPEHWFSNEGRQRPEPPQ